MSSVSVDVNFTGGAQAAANQLLDTILRIKAEAATINIGIRGASQGAAHVTKRSGVWRTSSGQFAAAPSGNEFYGSEGSLHGAYSSAGAPPNMSSISGIKYQNYLDAGGDAGYSGFRYASNVASVSAGVNRQQATIDRLEQKAAIVKDNAFRQWQADEAFVDKQSVLKDTNWWTRTNNGMGGGSNTAIQNMLPGTMNAKAYFPGFGKGSLYAMGQAGTNALAVETEAILTGRRDYMKSESTGWGLAGGIVGAGIGALFGGYGGLVGASVGVGLGTQAGQFYNAKEQSMILMRQASLGAASINMGSTGVTTAYDATGAPGVGSSVNNTLNMADSFARYWGGADGKQGRAAAIGQQYWNPKGQGFYSKMYEQYYMDYETMSQVYGDVQGSLIAGGINPRAHAQQKRRGSAINAGSTAGLMVAGGDLGVAPGSPILKGSSFLTGGVDEIGDTLLENLAIRYGMAGKNVFNKSVAPILAGLPESGQNTLDILLKHGSLATSQYYEAITDTGTTIDSKYTDAVLRPRLTAIRKSERDVQFAATRVRGVGAATQTALSEEAAQMGGVEGGVDSLAMAKIRQQSRGAIMQQQHEEDIVGYDIPMTRLSGQRARANILPFGPGNIFGLDLKMLGMEQKQLSLKKKQLDDLRGKGLLSEEEELKRTSEIENLQTSSASHVAELADGMVNRLPAFSSGRPSRFSSFDSNQLAQMQLMKVGHPGRYYGAFNGQQAEMQDAFIRSYAVPGTGSPYSKTQGIDATLPVLERIADTLDKISRNQQTSGRPGDNRGPSGSGSASQPGGKI